MLPIQTVAEKLGLQPDQVLIRGPHVAKLALAASTGPAGAPRGRLILVSAITPTRQGEGKTLVSIGLAQGLAQLGRRAVVTLRQPSLGPLFGVKGGATGGGRASLLPRQLIDLHLTGDFHAIAAAHNLLAAAIDAHLFHGNELRLVPEAITWPRAMDMNDRALRHITVGQGGPSHGVPRATGFVITAASEIMAVLALSRSRSDLRRRLDSIVIGVDDRGRLVRAGGLKVTGAMLVLLHDAILPNLVQTTEGTPALVHAGPFGNIAHGTSSVIAQETGLRHAEFVVNECGFGADLGAEKYFDIVMPATGIQPSAVVLVATARALAAHGAEEGSAPGGAEAVRRGLPNLARHLASLRRFRVPVVVAINRFTADQPEELQVIREYCAGENVPCRVIDAFARGGPGARDLAEVTVALAEARREEAPAALYPPELPLAEKIAKVAREIYGAAGVIVKPAARERLEEFTREGFGHLPVCMAKTQSSVTDDPKRPGAPTGWDLTVTDARLAAGAGFVVAIAGNMMLMPGLPREPRAWHMDVDDDGVVSGLE